ncbi:MAG: hypothetical protein ACXWQR_19895 [Ktedonobacterales bacterium]
MAQLGQPSSGTAAPSAGYFFDYTGNSQYWSGIYTMPAGGGIVTDLFVYVGGYNGTSGQSTTGQLVIWGSGSHVVWQSGTITIPAQGIGIGNQAWVHVSVPNVYLQAGNYNFGVWAVGGLIWTYESSGSTNYQRTGSVATLAAAGTEGSGALGAYITYTPGGIVRINTGTAGAPVWTVAQVAVNTGTPGSPVWTPARLQVNQGTPGAPNWVDAT